MEFTPASFLGRWLAPLLAPLHRWGLFELWVYVPATTVASAMLLYVLWPRLASRAELRGSRKPGMWLWLDAAASWLGCAALAVGLKSLIVEELDYGRRVWFEAWVGPVHLYICSAVALYLVLMMTRSRGLARFAYGYVSLALVLGYATATYRIIAQSWPDKLGGAGLIFLFIGWQLAIHRRLAALRAAAPTLSWRPAGRYLMTSACLLAALVFALFAYLQLNDLQQSGTRFWLGWVSTYGLVALVSLLYPWRPPYRAMFIAAAAVAVAAAGWRLPAIDTGSRIFANASNPAGNETGGLLIVALWLAWLAWHRPQTQRLETHRLETHRLETTRES